MKRLLVLLACWPALIWAEAPDVPQLLERIRHQGVAAFEYQETRQLELATAPWHGEGLMLSNASGDLVKWQQKPQRVIMAISGPRLLYWDAAQQQRHSASLDQAGAAAEQIAVFRNLLQGQSTDLQQHYALQALQQNGHWLLRLTPKNPDDADSFSLDILADAEAKQRRIDIHQADGETTTYLMTPAAPDLDAAATLQTLLREASGE